MLATKPLMHDTKAKNLVSNRHRTSEMDYRSLRLSFAVFSIAAAVVWLLFFELYQSLPYVQNGADAVEHSKWRMIRSKMFAPGVSIRIFAFGNSKMLAAFHPAVFESTVGTNIEAYNLAIPGEDGFVDLLEVALSNGNVPTHVLLQYLPKARDGSLLASIRDDNRIVSFLFPFRKFIRDVITFVYEASKAGGVISQYKRNVAQIRQVLKDRGYYFIKSQSHYPGDRLPDSYSLPTDRPSEVLKRTIDSSDTSDPEFARLVTLAERYDFQIVIVPVVYRRGEYSEPAAMDSEATMALKPYPRVHVIGAAYWLYPASEFSDPTHLNVGGGDRYSKELARSFASWLDAGR